MHVGLLLVALGFALSVANTAAAQADPRIEAARAAFDRASTAFDNELYTEAEDAFREAYDTMPADHPRRALVLLNIAYSVERQGGRDADALAAWERFRREGAHAAEAELLVRADDRIRELRERIARRGGANGSSTGGGMSPVGPIILAVGAVAALAGGGVGIYGLVERGDVLAACTDMVCPTSVQDRAANLEAIGVAADVLLFSGLGIAAIGVVLTLVLREGGDGDQVVVACGPTGCTLQGRW